MKTGRNARSQHANLEALRQHSGRRPEPQPWITSGPADQARATVPAGGAGADEETR
jgi:hypothetical protein